MIARGHRPAYCSFAYFVTSSKITYSASFIAAAGASYPFLSQD